MIAHISLASKNPQKTAVFFSQIIAGETFPFPVVPGAWIAVAKDKSGTAVEVYPETMTHHPGKGQADPKHVPTSPMTMPWEDQIHPDENPIRFSSDHVAIATELSEAQILEIGKTTGWRTVACDRAGVFRVVEIWVDNTFLVEVLTQIELARYRAFMNPKGCREMFGAPVA